MEDEAGEAGGIVIKGVVVVDVVTLNALDVYVYTNNQFASKRDL